MLLDDQADEAMPVIKAFSKAAVPVAYFDGTQAGLPAASGRLRGIRLAILDMDLGVGGSDANKASTLVSTLERIISPNNGPFGILIWTKHNELKDLVTSYIYERSNLPKPVFVETLGKSDVMKTTAKGKHHFANRKLARELRSHLAQSSPLECLQVWEGLCFEAATDVTNALAEHAESDAASLAEWRRAWQEETSRLLHSVGLAQAGKHLSSANYIVSLFLALNPLHSDRMDRLASRTASSGLASHVDLILAATGSSRLDRKARVNSMLHLNTEPIDVFEPGAVYVFGKTNKPFFFPKLQDVMTDVAANPKDQATLVASSRLCGIEISPVCDHAQNKLGLARIVAGLIVPHELANKFKKAPFLKKIGPFYVGARRPLVSGTYSFFLNSRYVIGPRLSDAKAVKPFGTLRQQVVSDIQSWAAFQSARQGVVMLS